jgi:hypothetical protein
VRRGEDDVPSRAVGTGQDHRARRSGSIEEGDRA